MFPVPCCHFQDHVDVFMTRLMFLGPHRYFQDQIVVSKTTLTFPGQCWHSHEQIDVSRTMLMFPGLICCFQDHVDVAGTKSMIPIPRWTLKHRDVSSLWFPWPHRCFQVDISTLIYPKPCWSYQDALMFQGLGFQDHIEASKSNFVSDSLVVESNTNNHFYFQSLLTITSNRTLVTS